MSCVPGNYSIRSVGGLSEVKRAVNIINELINKQNVTTRVRAMDSIDGK